MLTTIKLSLTLSYFHFDFYLCLSYNASNARWLARHDSRLDRVPEQRGRREGVEAHDCICLGFIRACVICVCDGKTYSGALAVARH